MFKIEGDLEGVPLKVYPPNYKTTDQDLQWELPNISEPDLEVGEERPQIHLTVLPVSLTSHEIGSHKSKKHK